MWSVTQDGLDFSDAWIESDPAARWRSASGHGPSKGASSSGSSVLELDEGRVLPRHTDSAEETIVVLAGTADVSLDGERAQVQAPGMALVPKDAPHTVRNAGSGTLRFAAIYADTDVVTRYQEEVQPDGDRERSPVE
jgi:quercetin dioxygenase-like cupin family protein